MVQSYQHLVQEHDLVQALIMGEGFHVFHQAQDHTSHHDQRHKEQGSLIARQLHLMRRTNQTLHSELHQGGHHHGQLC